MNIEKQAVRYGVTIQQGHNNLGFWCLLARKDAIRISSRAPSPEEAFEDAVDQMIAAGKVYLKERI